MNLYDKVETIMTTSVVTFSQETELSKIIEEMTTKNISTTLLLDDGKISGIITERDLVRKALTKCQDISTIKAKDVMTPAPLITAKAGVSIQKIIEAMKEYKVKSIPILIEGDDCTGIVTQTDIVGHLIDTE